jgi:hypothetical protein
VGIRGAAAARAAAGCVARGCSGAAILLLHISAITVSVDQHVVVLTFVRRFALQEHVGIEDDKWKLGSGKWKGIVCLLCVVGGC